MIVVANGVRLVRLSSRDLDRVKAHACGASARMRVESTHSVRQLQDELGGRRDVRGPKEIVGVEIRNLSRVNGSLHTCTYQSSHRHVPRASHGTAGR
eukprot:5306885-Prymnesium_polylepis.2